MRKIYLAGVAVAALAASLAALPASAQSSAQAAVPDPAPSTAIDDIVVTAQRKSENLQSTPLAITALSAETIKDRGIASAADLTALAPSVSVTTSPASATNMQLFIRGIGDVDPILTSDSPIGVYVDGIVLGRAAGSAFDLLDLERIEVLRGPQGTLYGRNTIGGAVNLISAKPKQDFGVEQVFGAGNFGFLQSKTSLDTGAIGDTGLSARLSYLHKERDGYVDDPLVSGSRDPGAYELNAGRLAVRYINGPLTADYAFDYSDRSGYASAFQLTSIRPDVLAYISASPGLGGIAPIVSENRVGTIPLNQGVLKDRVKGHTLNLDIQKGGLALRSLTGYRQWDSSNAYDNLGGHFGLVGFTVSPAILAPPNPFIPVGVTPLDLFSTKNTRHQEQFSQEFNILGNLGDKLDYVLGAYYFREDSSESNPQSFLLILPSPVPIPLTPTTTVNSFGVQLNSLYEYDHRSQSKAVFGQATSHLTDTLSFTGGIRYTEDEKRLTQRAPFTRTLNASFERVNYSANLDWQVTPTTLVYGRVATGYKAGGFNARSTNSGYEPEELTSYETGIKTDLFDRRLRFNGSAFYATHKDVQVQQLQAGTGGASSITVNAGEAAYWGLEAEITARPVSNVTLGLNVGYTNREYKKFLILDPISNTVIDVKDTARFVVGADTTVSAFADIDIARLSYGNVVFRIDYDYRGEIFFNPTTVGTPYNDQMAGDPRSLVNLRLSLKDMYINGASGELALWGKNVLNEEYRAYGIDFGSLGFAGNTFAEPATYGAEFRVKF